MKSRQGRSSIAPRRVAAKAKRWLNPISGQEYTWDAVASVWVPTGKYPLGANPMGFLGDGA